MFCPNCRAEYREGFYECADCGVALVEELPPEDIPEYAEYVTVIATGDSALLAVAKSLLDSADIKCIAKGEGLQDLFAFGRLGAGFNPLVGPVELQVLPEYAEEAKTLLADIKAEPLDEPEED